MPKRPRKADVFGPSRKGIVGVGIVGYHHDILVHCVLDGGQLKVGHLPRQPTEILTGEACGEVLNAGFATMQGPEVDHVVWNW